MLILGTVPVPWEPDFHAAMFIGVDLLAFGAGDDGDLGAVDEGLAREGWAVGQAAWLGDKACLIGGGGGACVLFKCCGLAAGMADHEQAVVDIGAGVIMALQGELETG